VDAAAAAVGDDAAAPAFSFAILAAAAAWPSDEHAVVAARTAGTSKPADACSDPRARTAAAVEGRVGCVAILEEALLHPLLDVVAAADLLRLLSLAEEGTNMPSRSHLHTAEDSESAEGRKSGHQNSLIRRSSGVAAGIGCRYRRRPCRVIHCGDVRRADVAVAGPVGGDVEAGAASHCLSFSSCNALLLLPAIDLDFSARPLLSMANLRSDDDDASSTSDDDDDAAAQGNARIFVPWGACDAPLPQAWGMSVRSASWSWQ